MGSYCSFARLCKFKLRLKIWSHNSIVRLQYLSVLFYSVVPTSSLRDGKYHDKYREYNRKGYLGHNLVRSRCPCQNWRSSLAPPLRFYDTDRDISNTKHKCSASRTEFLINTVCPAVTIRHFAEEFSMIDMSSSLDDISLTVKDRSTVRLQLMREQTMQQVPSQILQNGVPAKNDNFAAVHYSQRAREEESPLQPHNESESVTIALPIKEETYIKKHRCIIIAVCAILFFVIIVAVIAAVIVALTGRSSCDEQDLLSCKLGAEQGDPDAQYKLGYMYARGRGVPQSDEEAIKWLRKAAEQGHADGQGGLGLMYMAGKGVPQSGEEAVKWVRKAVEQGSVVGQSAFGMLYLTGIGVPQSDEEAVKWFRKAAEQGDADSQNNLGFMHMLGRVVPHSDEEAVKWLRKAAEQGQVFGQSNLGVMYMNGRGVPQSDEEAVKWFRKAAEQGDAGGQNNLGQMYYHGKGVPQSDEEAIKWFRKAADQGHSAAQNNLRILLSKKRPG